MGLKGRRRDDAQMELIHELTVQKVPPKRVIAKVLKEFGELASYEANYIRQEMKRFRTTDEFQRRRAEFQEQSPHYIRPSTQPDPELHNFRIGGLEEHGLPTESGGDILDLTRKINVGEGGIFAPANTDSLIKISWRQAQWYWRLMHCTPGLSCEDRFTLALAASFKEQVRVDLTDIEEYLTWMPWRSAQAHRRYLSLVATKHIPYIDWAEIWWITAITMHRLVDDPSEYYELLENYGYQSALICFPYPDLDPGDIEFINEPCFTPSQGLAIAKLGLVFEEGVNIHLLNEEFPEDDRPNSEISMERLYAEDPLEILSSEELKDRRDEIDFLWKEWPPYTYDYGDLSRCSRLLSGMSLPNSDHAEFVWRNLEKLRPTDTTGWPF